MRKFSTFVFVALLGVLVTPGTALPQTTDLPFQLQPSSGPAGTSFTANGAQCTGGEGTPTVDVKVYALDGTTVIDQADDVATTEGTWSTGAVLAVPAESPTGAYPVKATCSNPAVTYADQAFDVTPAAPVRTAAPAVVRGTTWFLRSTLSTGAADQPTFNYGDSGDQALMCDWDGDGVATPGVQRGFTFYLRNSNSTGVADVVIPFGNVGDVAVCGDWNGTADASNAETIGVVRGNQWFLRTTNDPANPATIDPFVYGDVGDQPKVGDWDGNGSATPGIRRGNMWFLRNSNTTGNTTIPAFAFGDPTDVPLVGDWNEDNQETPGVFRNGTWFFRNTLNSGTGQGSINYGSPGDRARIWFTED
jgi:hypothetical protein